MPALTRWHIKTSFAFLALALLLGIAVTLRRVIALPDWVSYLSPVYFHLIMVGWVTQMIFGVIFWMFPIVTRDRPRGSVTLGWTVYILLNTGLLLRLLAEPLNSLSPGAIWGWVLVVSAVAQWLAAVIFVFNSWPRVKEKYRGE